MKSAEERTFVAIKPDSVKRGLIGRIIKRFENKGYKIVGLKMIQVSKELAEQHYAEHSAKPFFSRLINYLTSGPIIAMVLQGDDTIVGVRKLMGSTTPTNAEVGTLRADFAQTTEFNVVHGSDSPESARREIDLYFRPEEICANWKTMLELVMESE
jgi:nucleoside-diphosphate kinase